MRGASVVLSAILMLVVAVASAAVFFGYINRLNADVTASGQKHLVETEVPPKLLALVCYDGYGYMYLSLSQGQNEMNGTVLYTVEKDTGTLVKEEFINVSLSGSGRLYLPVRFNTSERYKVTISGKKWALSEYCTPKNDPNLVLHLKLDEGTGTTAGDSSDYGNDCTINSASWSSSPYGYAVNFDGSSSHIDCGADEEFNTSEFTIFTWMQVSDLNSDHAIWGGFNTAGQAKNYLWLDSADNVQLDQSPPAGGTVVSSTISPTIFYNIIATKNSTRSAIFIDGQLSGSGPVEDYTGAAVAKWAAGYKYDGSPSAYFKGEIAELRIYSRALGPEEIGAIYAAYSG